MYFHVHGLKECCNDRTLCAANKLHGLITENGFRLQYGSVIGNHLIRAYDECASPVDARWVFDNMSQKTVISWNMMIGAYSQNCFHREALQLFREMGQLGIERTTVTFINALKACTKLSEGCYLFTLIKNNGFESDTVVSNALINMFGRCGSKEMALRTFLKMPSRDFITWTTMIDVQIQSGQAMEALRIFKQMISNGVPPSVMTYSTILNACNNFNTVEEGKSIHAHIVCIGDDYCELIAASLLTMYGKCGMLNDSRWLFDDCTKHNTVTWNSMMSVYIRHGHSNHALQLLLQMYQQSVKPNSVTFISILDACTELLACEEGKLVHNCMVDIGINSNAAWNALMGLYRHCGCQSDVLSVFDGIVCKDVVSWTSVIQIFSQSGCSHKVLQLLRLMLENGINPNKVTFVNVLKTFINSGELEEARVIHTVIVTETLDHDIIIGNALVTMYGNCKSPMDACKVFTSMTIWDAVSWTAMITAYAQSGYAYEAFDSFLKMLKAGFSPTNITYVSIFDVLTALDEGNMIYFLIINSGIESDTIIGNACINFYAKYGKVEEAFHVFDGLPHKDLVSWSAIVTTYAHLGKGREAFDLLVKMQRFCINPDDITFVSVLSACSHSGLIIEGFQIFYMLRDHVISPSEEHFRCMIDMFSRVGLLDEVETFINNMPLHPTIVEWMTILGACRVHGNVQKAESIAEYVLELNSENPAGYVILSNIYLAAGNHVDVDVIQKEMKYGVGEETIDSS